MDGLAVGLSEGMTIKQKENKFNNQGETLMDKIGLKNAFHEVWINEGYGYELEWENHWNAANNMRANNSFLYQRTVYPRIMRQLQPHLIKASFEQVVKPLGAPMKVSGRRFYGWTATLLLCAVMGLAGLALVKVVAF